MQYSEDIEVGDTMEFGEYHVTKEEIIDFAERYDPQVFHTDEAAAKDSAFGELVASGWHTASMCMRMLVDGPLQERAGMGARGVDELRWKRPVRPGDTLYILPPESRPKPPVLNESGSPPAPFVPSGR